MRGNLRDAYSSGSGVGSIPARAGEPPIGWPSKRICRVYPRACGGTWRDAIRRNRSKGLSPRVRGNLDIEPRDRLEPGSIPARAGEPRFVSTGHVIAQVYPRACGGTFTRPDGPVPPNGLSPRVRGNQGQIANPNTCNGSIPARAGEPHRIPVLPTLPAVYPRACGGTSRRPSPFHRLSGLSPRVRGNRLVGGGSFALTRSIPARAGEPSAVLTAGFPIKVYPRACGGTGNRWFPCNSPIGLSPRVRGNRSWWAWSGLLLGSIPARAGEPEPQPEPVRRLRVYPRACGGTRCGGRQVGNRHGLSPRVRGNPSANPRACGGTPWQIDIPYPQSLAKGR